MLVDLLFRNFIHQKQKTCCQIFGPSPAINQRRTRTTENYQWVLLNVSNVLWRCNIWTKEGAKMFEICMCHFLNCDTFYYDEGQIKLMRILPVLGRDDGLRFMALIFVLSLHEKEVVVQMNTANRVQFHIKIVCISHSTNTLGKAMNPATLPSAMSRKWHWFDSLTLLWQPVY